MTYCEMRLWFLLDSIKQDEQRDADLRNDLNSEVSNDFDSNKRKFMSSIGR